MIICYFTATGNCLYVAKQIGGELLSIPQLMKQETVEISDNAVGIISPVYAGEMPGMVRSFLARANIRAEYVFFIYTYGMSSSVARPNAIAAADKAGLKLSYVNTIKMVDNYLPGFEAQSQIDSAGEKNIDGQIAQVCKDIADRKKEAKKKEPAPKVTKDESDKKPPRGEYYKASILSVIERIEKVKQAFEQNDLDTCENELEIAEFLMDDFSFEDDNTKLLRSQIEMWKKKIAEGND